MKSRDICVWLDERWYNALSRHLKDETVEDKLGDYLDQLINELVPEQEYSRISQEALAGGSAGQTGVGGREEVRYLPHPGVRAGPLPPGGTASGVSGHCPAPAILPAGRARGLLL